MSIPPYSGQSGPPPRPVVTKPMLVALIMVGVLAVITAIVVVANNSGDDDGSAAPTTTTSAAGPTPDPISTTPTTTAPTQGDNGTVTALGVSYDYPADDAPFDPQKWGGPVDVPMNPLDVKGAVSYDACDPGEGSDLIAGIVESTQTDFAAAAEDLVATLPTTLWTAGVLSDTSTEGQTTATGLEGQVSVGTVTNDADGCGNTKARMATFAVTNGAGDVVVMFVSYRTDGDLEIDAENLKNTAAQMLFSLRLAT